MFIRAETLGNRTIEDIDKARQKFYQQTLSDSQEDFEENQKKQAQSISKYPDFAFKSLEELTQEERQKIIDKYYDTQILMVKTLGSIDLSKNDIKYGVKNLQELKKVPVSDEELLKMRKEVFPIPNAETQRKEREEILKNDFEKNIYFAIDKSSLLTDDFDRLCEVIKHYQALGMNINVLVDSKMIEKGNNEKADYLYTQEEKDKLNQLNNLINENGRGEIRFKECRSVDEYDDYSDFENAWTFDDIARANKAIDDLVEFIKINKLSPFETMVFIHDYITSTFKYKEGKIESCRVIPGAFKNGDIVCAGYASMVKAIIDKLGNKDLSCDIVGCSLYKGKVFSRREGCHSHNMIHIHDEKYGIDGVYMEDACWDSKRENSPEGRGFAHCLYPVTDLEHFRGTIYVPSTNSDRFSNIIIDANNIKAKTVVFRPTLPRPWMTVQYGDKSKPITMEKYEKCLKRVYGLIYNGDKEKTEEKVEASLKSSALISKGEFKNGDSCFSTTDRYKINENGKFSLAENDGRAPSHESENENE